MPHEDEIRDALADRLELIEPGLVFVETNMHLRNPLGADGYVDIVARDAIGTLVIIELKRADSSAREAMHEVGKYLDLMVRAKGVKASQLRAVVVSTTWHELLVPFSYYAAAVDFRLQGFCLELGPDGVTPSDAVEVEPVAPASDRIVTEYQRQIEVPCTSNSDAVWESAQRVLENLGVEDFLARHLRHARFGDCLILAMGSIQRWRPLLAWKSLLNDLAGVDAYEEGDFEGLTEEELALLYLDHALDFPIRPSDPMKAGSLIDNHGWYEVGLNRAGVFSDERVFTDDELRRHLEGWSADQSDSRFKGTAHPANRTQWAEFVAGVEAVLPPGSDWDLVVPAWIATVAAKAKYPVGAYIYVQEDFLQTLVSGWDSGRMEEFTSEMALVVQATDGTATGLRGVFAWGGAGSAFEDAVAEAYPSPGDWADARAEHDFAPSQELMRLLDLHHVVLEKNARDAHTSLLTRSGGTLVRTSVKDDFLGRTRMGSYFPIDEFFRSRRAGIDRVVATLRGAMMIDDSGALQVHVIKSGQYWPWDAR